MDGIARSLGRLAAGVRIAARTALPVDSNPVPADWRHVTKVDPESDKRLPLAYPLYLRHTDAVSVGGSRDVTPRNTERTFDLLAYSSTPAFHEPSAPAHVTDDTRDRAAFMAIPEVLNGDVESLVGEIGGGVRHVREQLAPAMLRDTLPWVPESLSDRLSDFAASWMLATANFEAYIIQNPDSAAAREAGVAAEDTLSPEEAARRALGAERRLGSELLYVEYSGTYGDEEGREVVAAVDEARRWSRLWYGGGIDSRERTEAMLAAGADAVVVGDAFHRVAGEEADLAERALAASLDDPDRAAVRDWLADRVDPEDSAAVRYLSTIPSVSDPEAAALDYLSVGVDVRLTLERIAADLEDPDLETLRSTLSDRDVPGERAMVALGLGRRGEAYAGAAALAVLGARVGLDPETLPLSPRHLGVGARILAGDADTRQETETKPEPEP